MELEESYYTVTYKTKDGKINSKSIINPMYGVNSKGKRKIDIAKLKLQVKKETKIEENVEILSVEFEIEE